MFTAVILFILASGEEYKIVWTGTPFPTIEACEAQFEKDKVMLEAQVGVPIVDHICLPAGDMM